MPYPIENAIQLVADGAIAISVVVMGMYSRARYIFRSDPRVLNLLTTCNYMSAG